MSAPVSSIRAPGAGQDAERCPRSDGSRCPLLGAAPPNRTARASTNASRLTRPVCVAAAGGRAPVSPGCHGAGGGCRYRIRAAPVLSTAKRPHRTPSIDSSRRRERAAEQNGRARPVSRAEGGRNLPRTRGKGARRHAFAGPHVVLNKEESPGEPGTGGGLLSAGEPTACDRTFYGRAFGSLPPPVSEPPRYTAATDRHRSGVIRAHARDRRRAASRGAKGVSERALHLGPPSR